MPGSVHRKTGSRHARKLSHSPRKSSHKGGSSQARDKAVANLIASLQKRAKAILMREVFF